VQSRHSARANRDWFTADEEVGIGIEKFDVQSFGADFAYTVDGGTLGEISDETWSARAAIVTFLGKSTHPGTAKDVMVNSIYALADYVLQIPRDMLPETTEGRVSSCIRTSGARTSRRRR
jgi:tripeptide aminopeptidase